MIYSAISNFNIDIDDVIYKVNLPILVLMVRQKMYNDSEGKAMTLGDKELIDKMK